MKRFFSFVMILIVIAAAFLTFAYTVDHLRMSSGQETMFFSWGKELKSSNEETVSVSSNAEENVETIPGETVAEENHFDTVTEATFYFADENFMTLKAENRSFPDGISITKLVEAIISGPESKDLYALIPEKSGVLSASVSDEGVCIVDLSSEFANFEGGSSMENMAIFSLVNSLCSVDGISKVKINIEGNDNAIFGSHYSLEETFSQDLSVVSN